MIDVAVLSLRGESQPLWFSRAAGLSLLGRALLALGDVGVRTIVLVGGGEGLVRSALAGRRSKASLCFLGEWASPADIAEVAGLSPSDSILLVARPCALEKANLKALLSCEDACRFSTTPHLVAAPLSSFSSLSAPVAGLALREVAPVHPALALPLSTEEEVRAAEEALLETTRKPVAVDGVVAYYAMRPVSRRLTRSLWDTPLTPNQITLISMLLGLLAAPLAAAGGYQNHLLATLLLFAGATVDCVDGEIARLKHLGSRSGEWLDTLSDDLSTAGYLIGLGLGVPWLPGGLSPFWFGLGTAILFLLSNIYIYYVLAVHVGVIDTTRFPYFFLSAPGRHRRPDTLRGKIAGLVVYALKRDFFVAFFVLLALCDAPWLSLLLLGCGSALNAGAALLTGLLGKARG
jgi:phosphatidylglycerophosphate synthase